MGRGLCLRGAQQLGELSTGSSVVGEKTLERTSKAAGASYRPLSVVSGTVTGMKTTTQEPIDLIVDSRLLSHEFHLAETIECACGYRRPADYRPEPRGVLS